MCWRVDANCGLAWQNGDDGSGNDDSHSKVSDKVVTEEVEN